jgi:hypothetical protein
MLSPLDIQRVFVLHDKCYRVLLRQYHVALSQVMATSFSRVNRGDSHPHLSEL